MGAREQIEAEIHAALAARDPGRAAELYAAAAEAFDAEGAGEAAAFFRVAGFVHALEAGAPLAERLSDRLAAEGREHAFRFV